MFLFLLSTEWVDCGGAHEISGIKAPLFSVVGRGSGGSVVVVEWVGFGVCGVLVRDVVGGGGSMDGGMADGVEEGGLWCGWWGGWCAGKF